jgi:hypothetical protein
VNIAVLTLTRDRLAYSRHCLATLQENAGCVYDHFVLDQASTDGTADWLDGEYEADHITAYSVLTKNIGICRGLNLMLDEELDPSDYDVIVKFDNDCELLTPDTLRDVCEAVIDRNAILSPRIHGLRNPPNVFETINGVSVTAGIGGIFMAAPARVFADGYRHNERNPLWGGDDHDLSMWWSARGGVVGYLDGYDANHYLGTDGQADDDTAYWDRKLAEMAA